VKSGFASYSREVAMEGRDELLSPLRGRLVLDVSQGIAGPYCAALLGAHGARVIKVEPPHGDWARQIGHSVNGMSALSIGVNGGKESVVLDTVDTAGRDALISLAQKADIIVESFRPGVAARIGLDYPALRSIRPALVFVSISGFGPHGPYADRPGTDSVMQALSGMMHMNRGDDGTPRAVGMYLVDTVAGLYAAQATLAASLRALRDGEGAHVQVPLLDCANALLTVPMLGEVLGRGAPSIPLTVPSGIFSTADGFLRVTSVSQKTFEALSRALDRPDWLNDTRYATAAARSHHATTLNAEVAEAMTTRSSEEWLALMTREGVLCAPVNDYEGARRDEHVVATGAIPYVAQPFVGPTPMPRIPGATRPPAPSPELGADTARILSEFGLDV
jgi:crotonobetainyl-CoA:carnitine CoA-transferase CaiB-like acyl-CoA transferase